MDNIIWVILILVIKELIERDPNGKTERGVRTWKRPYLINKEKLGITTKRPRKNRSLLSLLFSSIFKG